MGPGTLKSEESSLIFGFHAVRETLLRGGVTVSEIWVATGRPSQRIGEIRLLAAERHIPVLEKSPKAFAERFPETAHQGVAAVAESFRYAGFEEEARKALAGGGHALLVALDHLTDEGNLGALIRTGAFFGIDVLILPRDRSARISPLVLKRSSGACAILPIVQVVNLARALEDLKAWGYWVIGTGGESGCSIYAFDWRRPVVLVLGNEEKGVSPAVRKCCDEMVAIPGTGQMESLNVSAAGAVILAEIRRRQAMQGSPL